MKFGEIEYDMNYLVLAYIIIAFVIVNILYVFITSFEKVITVKDKYNKISGKRRTRTGYMFVDENDNIYKMVNVWWRGEFNKEDDWARLNKNNKYRLYGFSSRIPILGMYPSVYSISKL